MTQKDKELLLIKDLCVRLPYKVYAQMPDKYGGYTSAIESIDIDGFVKNFEGEQIEIKNIKPYLIPLASMDDELKNVIKWKLTTPLHDSFDEDSLEDLLNNSTDVVNYCYEHYLDINGLIERGLALEAPEGMYN